MGCYRLRDFTNQFSFYVGDNTYPGASFANYAIGSVLRLTLPTSFTGFPYAVTSCMQLGWDPNCPNGYPSHDLGPVTDFGVNGYYDCQQLIGVVSCTNITETYSFYISDETVLSSISNCTTTCNNCQPALYIDATQTQIPVGCWTLGEPLADGAINIDFYNPTITVTCSNTPCEVCSATCYLVTLCNDIGQPFIISNPTGSPLVLDQVVEAVITITPANSEVMTFSGCMTITELENCNPLLLGSTSLFPIFEPTDVQIDNPPVTHPDCNDCLPPPNGYILRRCDDPGISFTASNNISGVVGKVVTGVTITNCNSTSSICASVKPEQCWTVDYYDFPGDYNIQYQNTLKDCTCCPGPCD